MGAHAKGKHGPRQRLPHADPARRSRARNGSRLAQRFRGPRRCRSDRGRLLLAARRRDGEPGEQLRHHGRRSRRRDPRRPWLHGPTASSARDHRASPRRASGWLRRAGRHGRPAVAGARRRAHHAGAGERESDAQCLSRVPCSAACDQARRHRIDRVLRSWNGHRWHGASTRGGADADGTAPRDGAGSHSILRPDPRGASRAADVLGCEWYRRGVEELTLREAVRKRPGMYVGDTEDGSGLVNLILGVIANAYDHHLAGRCSNISMTIAADGTVSVEDDGPGFCSAGGDGLPPLDTILTQLSTMPTVDGHRPHVHLGLGGLGLAVVNAASEHFELVSVRDGTEVRARYVRGELVEPIATTDTKRASGTRIRFRPDPDIFKHVRVPRAELTRILEDLSFLAPKLRLGWSIAGDDLAARGLVGAWRSRCRAPSMKSPMLANRTCRRRDRSKSRWRLVGGLRASTRSSSPSSTASSISLEHAVTVLMSTACST